MIWRRRRSAAQSSHKWFLDAASRRKQGDFSPALTNPKGSSGAQEIAIDVHIVQSDPFYREPPFEGFPGLDAIKRADALNGCDRFGNIVDEKAGHAVKTAI